MKGLYVSTYKEEELVYTIKTPKIFKNQFTIENNKEEVVATFTSKFRWFKATEYILQVNEGFGDNAVEKFLLILIVQFYRQVVSAAVTVATAN